METAWLFPGSPVISAAQPNETMTAPAPLIALFRQVLTLSESETIDIVARNALSEVIKKGGRSNAGVLYEAPDKEGDEGCQEHNHEEWQAGESGCMPRMRD